MRTVRSLLLPALLLSAASPSAVFPVPPTCAPNCVPALAAAIQACAALRAPCTVQLEAGTYNLQVPHGGTALTLAGLQDFVLAGAGDATLLVLSDIANLIAVSGGRNVTLARFAVDSARVPFTLGTSIAASPEGTVLAFDARGLYAVDLQAYPWLQRAQSVLGYDAALGRPAAPPNVTDIYELDTPIPVTYLSTAGAAAQLRLEGRVLPLGQTFIVRHQVYSFNAFTFTGTTGLALLNTSLFSMGGMGLLTDKCTDIVVDGLSIRKLPGRPMSITADGMHFSNTRGGRVLVQNSLLEGQGDDGMNIPTIFQQVGAISSDGLTLQLQGRNQPCPSPPNFLPGDAVNFFNISDLALLGQGTVASLGPNLTVVLAAPPPLGVGLFTLVNNAAQVADSVVLLNNVFRNNRARGALLKSSNVYVSGNVFEGMSLSAVKTETDGCYWFEGHPVTNWTFVHNTVRDVNSWSGGNSGDVLIDNSVPTMVKGVPDPQRCYPWVQPTSFVQHSLNISYNTIASPWGAPVAQVQSTDGLALVGNTVTRAGGRAAVTFDLVGQGTARTAVSGNVCDGAPCSQSGFY